jgi:hypothetical protein
VNLAGLPFDATADVEKDLNKQLDEVQKQITQQVDCERVTAALTNNWRSLSMHVGEFGAQTYYANLVPQRAGFSRFAVEDSSLRLAATVEASVEI